MKKRLISDAGISGNNVNVYTYHGFCNEILSNYPDDFVGFSGAKILTLATKYALIKTCIDKLDVKYLRTAGYSAYFYVNTIM